MRVLLVSVTAGYGHHATAEALEYGLQARGHTVLRTDIFKQISKALYRAVDRGYHLSTKYTPSQYGRLYRSMEKSDLLRRSMLAFLQSELLSDRFYEQVDSFKPDAVVCTHVSASQIIGDLIGQRVTRALHVGVVTDYTLHPFWELVRSIDYYILPSKLLAHRAIGRGIPAEKLLSLGIPVHPRYTEAIPREEAARALDIDPSLYTVLFMAGSMGFGNMTPAVEGLAASGLPVQALCVCGTNRKLAERLRKLPFRVPVRVYDFVKNVDVMMSASDCVVTKPGGLTVTEALAKKLPIILQTPIPGHEEQNAEFLINCNLAMRATDSMRVEELLNLMLATPALAESMRRAIDRYISPNATERICDWLEETVKNR